MRNLDFGYESIYELFKEFECDKNAPVGVKDKGNGKGSLLKICWDMMNVVSDENEQKIKDIKDKGKQQRIADEKQIKALAAKAKQRKRECADKIAFADRIKVSMMEELQEREML